MNRQSIIGQRNSGIVWVLMAVLWMTGSTASGWTIYVDADATGANDGSSWADAFNYLQDALAVAGSGEDIWVAEGVYRPDRGGGKTAGDREATFQLTNGVAIYGGFPSGGGAWEGRDPKAHETILSGDLAGDNAAVSDPSDLLTEPTRAENSYHVVTGSGTDAAAILDGFTIMAGNADEDSWPNDCGGGMFNDAGYPTLSNCIFSNNSANENGGGIYNWDGSEPNILNCAFINNTAGYGGGINCHTNSSPTIANSIFIANTANFGGGIYNQNNSNPTVDNCIFINNTANSNGGGMSNWQSSPSLTGCVFGGNYAWDNYAGLGGGIACTDSNVTISNCTISGNYTGYGGGIYCEDSNTIITNCTISGNTATAGWFGGGGGILLMKGDITISNCTISGNTAGWFGGGGIYCLGHGRTIDNWTITNCTISGNSARTGGSGIFCALGKMTITDCTINNNNSTDLENSWGGGILCSGDYHAYIITELTMTNCIIKGNSARWGGGIYCVGYHDNSMTINNCTIVGNRGGDGGGIYTDVRNMGFLRGVITNSTISGNFAEYEGGGIFCCDYSNATIANCAISGNSARCGGGIRCSHGKPTISNCTIIGNSASESGGGIYCWRSYRTTIANGIIWDNYPEQIKKDDDSTVSITYSDVQSGWPGDDNIDEDPCFADLGYWADANDPNIIVEPNDPNAVWVEGDYHLFEASPCIDAGDNNAVPDGVTTDLDGNPRFVDEPDIADTGNGTPPIVDMGAYEYNPPVAAEVDIEPDTLNLQSKGVITAFIELPEPYSVEDIAPDSLLCQGAGAIRTIIAGDILIVKFDREELQELQADEEVELLVSGELADGTRFEGKDVIRVIDKGGKKKN